MTVINSTITAVVAALQAAPAVATVGRQAQILVLHTSEDSAKGRQEAAPGVAAALQHLLASCIGCFAQLGA